MLALAGAILVTLSGILQAKQAEPLVDGVTITSINIHGSTVLSASEVEEILDPYLRRQVYVEDLQSLTSQLTQLYIARGYVSSGAKLAGQDLRDGTLDIYVTEGELTQIEITDSGGLPRSTIQAKIEREISNPLNIEDLRRALNRIEAEASVSQVNAQLLPGDLGPLGEVHAFVRE